MIIPGVAHKPAAGRQLDDVIEMHINLRTARNIVFAQLLSPGTILVLKPRSV